MTLPAPPGHTTIKPWLNLSPDNLIRTLWQGRVRLVLFVVIFAALGVVVALLTRSEYASEARIMPEMNSGSGDVFRRLASVAGFGGIDLSDAEGVDAVRPDLYPNVLQSTPFILYLLDQPVVTSAGEKLTVAQLLDPEGDKPSFSLLSWLRPAPVTTPTPTPTGPNKPVKLTMQQQQLAEEIEKRVTARLDTRSGVISITAQMPDASAAATVAQQAMNYLTQYVTSYRTEKARQDLHFYSQRLTEARRRYQTAQYNVFHYNDQHKYLVVQSATMDRQRMEAELTIAQTVYTELSRQYEQARLKVQERTPVFKVLEPPKIPLLRVSPKRAVLVLTYALVGFILGIVYLLTRQAGLVSRLRGMIE
jgi:uncharacterized protein involved in exopolysaccharide biosynthesis